MISQLLHRLEQLQVKESSVFPKGMFASYRTYALNKDREKADVNAFFTGLICFTLRDLKPMLSATQQQIADSIILSANPIYEKFKNRNGKPTYNFWPTDTPMIFPNAGWMNLMDRKQALADDLDDTVIFMLAQNSTDSTARKVHALMQAFTNQESNPIKNTYPEYRKIGAYSVWFGKKMPVDFDICVLANVLFFVQQYHLDWTKADSASLHLIENVIEKKQYKTAASYISPHYQTLPVILYHLSRLMAKHTIPSLEKYKPQLIADAKEALANASSFMESIILQTSLIRWGVEDIGTKKFEATSLEDLIENKPFSFFIANMSSMLPNPLKNWIGWAGVGRFDYDCDAYNNLLVLEYLVLLNR